MTFYTMTLFICCCFFR